MAGDKQTRHFLERERLKCLIGSTVSRFDSSPDSSNPETTLIGATDFLRGKDICKRSFSNRKKLGEREMKERERERVRKKLGERGRVEGRNERERREIKERF